MKKNKNGVFEVAHIYQDSIEYTAPTVTALLKVKRRAGKTLKTSYLS